MPTIRLKDADIHYDLAGPKEAPALILSNSLGTNFSMWDPQMPAFTKRLRVLRYDTRGHGQSSVTPGPYTFAQLGADVLALADALKIESFSFCGLSMGGMIGMWLGIHAPKRVQKLVLCSTAAKIGTPGGWNTRIESTRKGGMKSISSPGMERWFTARFRETSGPVVTHVREILEQTSVEGYIANCGALRDADFREELSTIRAETLIISGTHDIATPPADGHFLESKIAGARYVELDAAHLSNIERADRFTQEVNKFLSDE